MSGFEQAFLRTDMLVEVTRGLAVNPASIAYIQTVGMGTQDETTTVHFVNGPPLYVRSCTYGELMSLVNGSSA